MSSLATHYFSWLYDQVVDVNDPDSPLSYVVVCEQMHRMPFRVINPLDENRAFEGTALRNLFLKGERLLGHKDHVDLLIPDASVFEVLIGLTKRANFMSERAPQWWFMEFVRNLNLSAYSDKEARMSDRLRIDRSLARFNDRRYTSNGRGGIFPLHIPYNDQREVELWYQMAAYMTENEMY